MVGRTTARPTFAYVGCFTAEKRKARGKGIGVFRIDPGTGAWTQVEAYDAIRNPGYIALDPIQRFLYSAHGDSSEVGAYARDAKSGKLKLLNKQQTGGNNSSTVMVDATGGYVLLSTGPGIAVYPVNPDGSLAPACENILPQGERGPWLREQEFRRLRRRVFPATTLPSGTAS